MGTVRIEKLTMRAAAKLVALILLFSSGSLLVTRADSVSPQNSHFLRSLRSGERASEDHFMCALRSAHFLRTLRGSKDLQRILRSSSSLQPNPIDDDDEEFPRGLRTTGHFLRSLRSPDADLGGHFLRSLRSAREFMRMVRSDGHFLRSLRDTPDTVQEPTTEEV